MHDSVNIYEEVDCPLNNQSFINDTKDEGEDEDGSEKEKDKGDHTNEEDEEVISISDDN